MGAQKQAQICNWEFKNLGCWEEADSQTLLIWLSSRGESKGGQPGIFLQKEWPQERPFLAAVHIQAAVSSSTKHSRYHDSTAQHSSTKRYNGTKQRDSTKRYDGTAQRDSTKRRQHRRTAQQKCTTAHTRHDSTEKTARNDMTAPHDGKTETHDSTARQHRTTAHT